MNEGKERERINFDFNFHQRNHIGFLSEGYLLQMEIHRFNHLCGQSQSVIYTLSLQTYLLSNFICFSLQLFSHLFTQWIQFLTHTLSLQNAVIRKVEVDVAAGMDGIFLEISDGKSEKRHIFSPYSKNGFYPLCDSLWESGPFFVRSFLQICPIYDSLCDTKRRSTWCVVTASSLNTQLPMSLCAVVSFSLSLNSIYPLSLFPLHFITLGLYIFSPEHSNTLHHSHERSRTPFLLYTVEVNGKMLWCWALVPPVGYVSLGTLSYILSLSLLFLILILSYTLYHTLHFPTHARTLTFTHVLFFFLFPSHSSEGHVFTRSDAPPHLKEYRCLHHKLCAKTSLILKGMYMCECVCVWEREFVLYGREENVLHVCMHVCEVYFELDCVCSCVWWYVWKRVVSFVCETERQNRWRFVWQSRVLWSVRIKVCEQSPQTAQRGPTTPLLFGRFYRMTVNVPSPCLWGRKRREREKVGEREGEREMENIIILLNRKWVDKRKWRKKGKKIKFAFPQWCRPRCHQRRAHTRSANCSLYWTRTRHSHIPPLCKLDCSWWKEECVVCECVCVRTCMFVKVFEILT